MKKEQPVLNFWYCTL